MKYQKSYGRYKNPPDFSLCAKKVQEGGKWPSFHQCRNKAKYDPDENGKPTTCGLHCDAKVKEKKELWEQQYEESNKRSERARIMRGLYPAMVEIAKGHNDPRQRAIDALEGLDWQS
jgi:hypothetical protein